VQYQFIINLPASII